MSFKSPYRMFPWMRVGRDAAMGAVGQTYAQKVLGVDPSIFAYWPLWEAAGPTAACLVNSPAQDGTYIGVTLANGTAPDGSPCPLFDGINDIIDLPEGVLNGPFDGDEGTLAIWIRVFNVGVWTDGATRSPAFIGVDGGANRITLAKQEFVDRDLDWRQIAGGVSRQIIRNANVETGWIHLGFTWSATADEVRAYYNGVQEGGTLNGLGAWVGALNDTFTCIGAYDPAFPVWLWHGWLAHCALWNTPLTQPQILDLATV